MVPSLPSLQIPRCLGVVADAVLLSAGRLDSATEAPPHLIRYLEGLDAPESPVRRPRSMSDWMVLSHVGAARPFASDGENHEAMAEYRAASAFAPPGGEDMAPNIADRRGNRQSSNFAVYAIVPELGEALIVLGRDAVRRRDIASAQVYLQQTVATPISRAQRQEVNELQMQLARMYRNR